MNSLRALLFIVVAVVILPSGSMAGEIALVNCRSCHIDKKYVQLFESIEDNPINRNCPGLVRLQLDSDLTMVRLKRLERWVKSLGDDGEDFRGKLQLAERRLYKLSIYPEYNANTVLEKNRTIRSDLHQSVFRPIFGKIMAERMGWFLTALITALLAWGIVWYIRLRVRKKMWAEVEAGFPGRNRAESRKRFDSLFREML